ncbi:MAG: T9SS type A sorting domain-containing protein [Bacteroidota bacterium]
MRKFLLYILVLCCSELQAQDTLRVRDVFDFNVGDVLNSSIQQNYKQPSGKIEKIISKTISLTNDTVNYVMETVYWSPIVNFNTNPPTVSRDYSIPYQTKASYSSLDSIISVSFAFESDSCSTFWDTTYFSNQNNSLLYEYVSLLGGCFEGTYINEKYAKGLGRVYHRFQRGAEGYETEIYTTLSPVSINEVKIANNLVLYPNPTTKELNVFYDYNSDIRIYSLMGNEILSFTKEQTKFPINISELPKGLYLIKTDKEIQKIIKQ